MRLYNTEGAAQVDDPEYGTFKPGETGAFDGLPDGMYAKLHGRPGWENEAERTARLAAEQMEKLRDPATMLAELQKMTAGQGELAQLLANALGVGRQAEPADAPAVKAAADSEAEPAATEPEAESGTDPEESESGGDGGSSEPGADTAPEVAKPARAKTQRASKKAVGAPPEA